MSGEHNELTCTVNLEWTNGQGSLLRKLQHRSATLRLIRNGLRDIIIEVRADKAKTVTKLTLKGISVFNKFMSEGKATIKFQQDKCTMFLSNAPSAQLTNFLKTVFVKMTGQAEKPGKPTLKERLFSDKVLGPTQDISPVTSAEVNKAKEKALAVSRATITTPSPSATRKRKIIDENGSKLSTVKRLYDNPILEKLTDEQTRVLEAVRSGKNVFFTGSAGTGKSFLLKRIIASLPPDVTVSTASTGVAACHIGGITLHQFAGIGLGTATLERCYQLASRSTVVDTWRRTKHLIIDEISMVDGEFFDKIEAVARRIRKNEKPFGGIQLILCGDFFQLPPVSKNDTKATFCFQSKAWQEAVHLNFELQKVHRQKDPVFINILNSIRIGNVTEEIVTTLKATATQKIEGDGILATRLCSHINEANEINNFQLNELKTEIKEYVAQDSDQTVTKMLDQQLPVSSKLSLKVGAQVMLLKNINVSKGLVNGARGVITKFVDGLPLVQFRSGTQHLAKLEKWTIKTTTGALIHRKQVPLKLAWAFSIHKSQGLTLDCVEMCLTRVFDAGQSYVALSRAESLQSLRILDFKKDQVWANIEVLKFYRRFRRTLHEMEMIPLGKRMKLK